MHATENPPKVLLVDLNNFARYPTLSIGYLASILRKAGYEVGVFAPLMIGIGGVARESRSGRLYLLVSKLNYLVATLAPLWMRLLRSRLASWWRSGISRNHTTVIRGFEKQLLRFRPNAVMISTYLMYKKTCTEIVDICNREVIPVIIGGPYFVETEVINEWSKITGLQALVAGEIELRLPAVVESLLKRDDLSQHEGVLVANGALKGIVSRPLQNLDAIPFPDYRDFPWSVYPNRIVPIITGRGCGWGVCSFCSDVTSTAGRTFRTRDPENVLSEIAFHYNNNKVSLFVFTDLKLNSNLSMWRAICSQMQRVAPGARWIASVHAGAGKTTGLSLSELKAAGDSGCVRLTTGLESGSQRMAQLMRKGTRVESISRLLHDATDAGISCRCTMILGYPGETADDVHASTEFLQRHHQVIERVSLNRLQIVAGTELHGSIQRDRTRYPDLKILRNDRALALVDHRLGGAKRLPYIKAALRLLTAVHDINEKPLSHGARAFEGVM